MITNVASTACMENFIFFQQAANYFFSSTQQPNKNNELELNSINAEQNSLIKELYHHANDTVDDFQQSKLINLLTCLDRGKTNNIDACIMREYAFCQWADNKQDASAKITIVFDYLKNYEQKKCISYENIPTIQTITTPNKTAQPLLNNPSIKTNRSVYDKIPAQNNYPLFDLLQDQVSNLATRTHINNFLIYVYNDSDQDMPRHNYAALSYDELKKEFYSKAEYIIKTKELSAYQISLAIYNLLEIIEIAKTFKKDTYHFALDFIPSKNFSAATIASFCHSIKRYNINREGKITPTPQQFENYYNRPLNFTSPPGFDITLFDEELYAFEQFNTLKDAIIFETCSPEEQQRRCLEQFLPTKNNIETLRIT